MLCSEPVSLWGKRHEDACTSTNTGHHVGPCAQSQKQAVSLGTSTLPSQGPQQLHQQGGHQPSRATAKAQKGNRTQKQARSAKQDSHSTNPVPRQGQPASPRLPGTQRPDPGVVLPCRGSQPSAALGCCLFPSTARALRSMSSLLQPWDVPLGSASLGWPPRPGLVPLGWVASSSSIPRAHTCPCWSHSHALHSHVAGCSNSGHQLIALLLFLAWRRVFAGR